jgi:hypothetical protein
MAKALPLAASLLLAGGCWNGDNDSINLGNVSLGQQMIDLKAALEQGAISRAEYDRLKGTLLSIDSVCGGTQAN